MSFSTILSAVIEGLEVAFIHVEADKIVLKLICTPFYELPVLLC